ncbi:Cyanovirin-N [Colletotrichum fructicola]|nr:Cyanovirin-N [Colletotrichum fructicola]
MLAASVIRALLAFAPALALAKPASVASSASIAVRDDEISLQSFASSCRNCRMNYVSILSCECHNTIGQWVLANLDLGTCFTNDHCWLRWHGGGAFQTCRNPQIVDGFTLTAECASGDGVWCNNRINLNENIHNLNGNMVC